MTFRARLFCPPPRISLGHQKFMLESKPRVVFFPLSLSVFASSAGEEGMPFVDEETAQHHESYHANDGDDGDKFTEAQRVRMSVLERICGYG